MLILEIETSTPREMVSLVRDGEVIAEVAESVGRGHTESLLRAVHSLLEGTHVELRDLDAMAVSIGPGRFSGLRVGLATAKGLSASTRIPIFAVPTLEALAESARPCRGAVCPVLDARRGEAYGALFEVDGGRTRLMDDVALSPGELAEAAVAAASGREVLFLGSGAVEYRSEISTASDGRALFPRSRVDAPVAGAMSAVAEEGSIPALPDADELEPIYLRGI